MIVPDRHEGALMKVAVALAVSGSLLGASVAIALDRPITGKRLWLKSTPKLVLLSQDAGIDVAGYGPPCPGGDSSLVVYDGVDTARLLLPCANWRTDGSGAHRYRNSSPLGGAAVARVAVGNGRLKVVAKDIEGISVPNGPGTLAVVLNLDGVSRRFCASFSGVGDGRRFLVKDAPAGSCPGPRPCDATTGGFCWFLGVPKASCDAACAIEGRAYDAATESYAGSGGTDAGCIGVLDALGVPAGPLFTNSSCFAGLGCVYAPPTGRARCAAPPTDPSSSGGVERVCACQ
jgi:hypothetical protein